MAAPNYYFQSSHQKQYQEASAKDVNGTPSAYEPPYQPPYQPPYPPPYQPPYQPPNQTQYQGAPQPTFYGAPPPVVVPQASRVSFTGAIILSCVVYWCCGILFGSVALILAMVGQTTASSGNEKEAKQYLNSSYLLSAIGIVVGVVVIIVVGVLFGLGIATVTTSYNRGYSYRSYY